MRPLVAAALFAALFAALVPRATAASGNYVNMTTTYYTDKDCKTKCTSMTCNTMADLGSSPPLGGQIYMDKCLPLTATTSTQYSGSCSGGTRTVYATKNDCTGASASAPNPPLNTCVKDDSMTKTMGADTYVVRKCVNGPGVSPSSASAVAPSMAAAVLLGLAVSALSRS